MGLDIERRFAHISYNGDLLTPITPDMDPEEAMARLQEYNRRDLLPNTITRYAEHLRQAGVQDADTWTYYELNSADPEKIHVFLREHWPHQIESLIVPGQWSGGGEYSKVQAPKVEIRTWRGPAEFSPNGYTVYLRLASKKKSE